MDEIGDEQGSPDGDEDAVEFKPEDEEVRATMESAPTEAIQMDEESEVLRRITDPRMPTQKEKDDHYFMGHAVYRNWCPICVQSRGREMGHKAMPKDKQIPEYAFDYCFPGDKLGYKWTVLVGKERDGKAFMAETVPHKGGVGRFAADKCVQFMEECGDKEYVVIVKTDQETAIQVFVSDIVDNRTEGRTIQEQSPVGSSGSNGMAERAVQEMEGLIRAILLSLEERLGMKLDARERIIAFIPTYAAYLANRVPRGEDGKTVYERTRGKKTNIRTVEFGEKLLYMKGRAEKMGKLAKIEPRFGFGIFVGVHSKSGMAMVSTLDGIKYSRTLRRLTEDKRWTDDTLSIIHISEPTRLLSIS